MNSVERCIANVAKYNNVVKAFAHLRDPSAIRSEWAQLDENASKLVIGLKDNICSTDQPTACASNILRGYISPYDATVVKLLRQSKSVAIMGKTNMDEFAMGSNNEHTIYGRPSNPRFLNQGKEVSTGGSSGGSAAAVAAGMCHAALGTDTGGSVRLPSAYCGVVGFKPSYGRISRYGVISYAQSLDTVGILSEDVDSCAQVFAILDKHDENDPTSLPPSIRSKLPSSKISSGKKLTIGILREAIIDLTEPVRQAWISALTSLEEHYNVILKEVSVPSMPSSVPAYFVISPAEATSNLARYDGIRYGTRAAEDRKGDVLYGPTRSEGFGPEVQRRLLLGTYSVSSDSYGSYFEKAQKVRRRIVHEFNNVFKLSNVLNSEGVIEEVDNRVDFLIHPTGRTLPPEYPLQETAIESLVNDVLTLPANIAGIPAISVPYGPTGCGMQVWGQYGDDQGVLRVAKMLESLQNKSG